MISKKNLTIDWLRQVSVKNNNADIILIEKVIRALLLLEGLTEQQLPFIFKGGTALMLHFNSSKRLSIDIDIVMQDSSALEPYFSKVIDSKGFIRVVEQERKANYSIEKAHFKFYYNPVYKTVQTEDYILLDILFEQPKYIKLVSLPIDSTFLTQDGIPLEVRVPSLNDLLGDKLTAFAPNTTGVPYMKAGVSRSMEIIKQLYDIGHLFDVADNVEIIHTTFLKFCITEMGYRNLGKDHSIVLDDIYNTALLISTRGLHGKGDLEALQLGLRQIKGYIFSESYSIEKAIAHASKAAYLSTLIRQKELVFEKFSNALEVKDFIIEQPFNTKLNKLKKSNPEAFFYWYKIYTITK